MRAIVEHLTGKGRIIETDRKKLPDGVLCRVTYPICNVGILNRNNRMYEQQVWDKVFQDPDIRQKLETRSLLGHAEHPKDTSQSSTEKVSHVVNKIWDDHKGKVATELDVLDTPYGRICDTLLRAGCGLGVSTRAEGELEETTVEGKQVYRVVPEAYSLKTIDFTADPSTYGAYPESVERDLVSQIGAGVKEKKIDQEYATMMLESMVAKEAKTLLENIKSDRHHKNCKCNPTEKKCTSGCPRAAIKEGLKIGVEYTPEQLNMEGYKWFGGKSVVSQYGEGMVEITSPDNWFLGKAIDKDYSKFKIIKMLESKESTSEAHKPDCDCGFCKQVAANKAKAADSKDLSKEDKALRQKELDSMKKPVKEASGMPGLAVEEPVKAIPSYPEMGDEALVGLARDYEAAIEKDSITQEMWKELGMIYNELRRRSKPVESLEKALNAHIMRIFEMMPGLAPVYAGGVGTAPGMNEKGTRDKFGRNWDLPKGELCPECGQPDNTGDCTHQKLSDEEVNTLKGVKEKVAPGMNEKKRGMQAFMNAMKKKYGNRWTHKNVMSDEELEEMAAHMEKALAPYEDEKGLGQLQAESVEEGWQAEIDSDLERTKKDPTHAEDVMDFIARLEKKYPNDKDAIHAYIEKRSKEPIKEEKGDGHHAIVNFEELYAKFQEMDLFTDGEVKEISESKTQIGLVEKITKVVEHIKRDLVIAKAERDTALSLGNSAYESLMENYIKDIQALTKQVQEAKEASSKVIESNAKKLKESIEKVATKVAAEVKSIYEDKLLKAKSHYESEIARMKLECNESIFQKTVIDVKIKESGLKDLPENAVTLLRRCKSETEVDAMLDQFRYAIKESFAHSGNPANISIDGSEQAESPLLDQTRMMLEVLNPKPVK